VFRLFSCRRTCPTLSRLLRLTYETSGQIVFFHACVATHRLFFFFQRAASLPNTPLPSPNDSTCQPPPRPFFFRSPKLYHTPCRVRLRPNPGFFLCGPDKQKIRFPAWSSQAVIWPRGECRPSVTSRPAFVLPRAISQTVNR